MSQKPSAINIIWLTMILTATVTAAYTGAMAEVTKASFESAKSAVTLAIGLIGPMALWLGLMKIAEAGGLMQTVARSLRPVMVRLFPDVPAEHPAMAAMIMNMAANMLGLGNAATPMGIKAMQELDRLAAEKGTATNAMCLFLAINTSSVTILPLGVITVRAAAGATSPASILIPSLIATILSTTVAIVASKLLSGPDAPLVTAPSDNTPVDTILPADETS
ncbi:MAG: nucleoside recognition domain-containing protein, partial [Desulfobulbaceae bacterium]|nr:nucleoside recognition domain-containing protein [Desulfobulbaceae bacterium]